MKTERIRPLAGSAGELLLNEEVIIERSRKRHRMLMAVALAGLPELIALKEPFQVRRLNGELLAVHDGAQTEGRTDFLVSLEKVVAYMQEYAAVIRRQTEQRLHEQVSARAPAQPAQPPPADASTPHSDGAIPRLPDNSDT